METTKTKTDDKTTKFNIFKPVGIVFKVIALLIYAGMKKFSFGMLGIILLVLNYFSPVQILPILGNIFLWLNTLFLLSLYMRKAKDYYIKYNILKITINSISEKLFDFDAFEAENFSIGDKERKAENYHIDTDEYTKIRKALHYLVIAEKLSGVLSSFSQFDDENDTKQRASRKPFKTKDKGGSGSSKNTLDELLNSLYPDEKE